MIEKAVDDTKRMAIVEREEREKNVLDLTDSLRVLEGSLRDEATMRLELDRRTAQDSLELAGRIQAEQNVREEGELKLEERLVAEMALREEVFLKEARIREEADAEILLQWQKALRDEQLQREEDRKDIV